MRSQSLSEHQGAHNHTKALDLVKSLVGKPSNRVTESDILDIHGLTLRGIDEPNAGRYRSVPVRISGFMVVLPNHMKVTRLMGRFVANILQQAETFHPVALATNIFCKGYPSLY